MIEKEDKLQEIACDSVVVAVGAKPRSYNDLSTYCEETGIPYHVIGDAVRARRALNAIAEAAEIARAI